MKSFKLFFVLLALGTSPCAMAIEAKEVITTTKTIERETEDGELEPIEKEVTTEVIIDIPQNAEQNPAPPICQFFPLPQRPEDNIDGSGQEDYFTGTEEFIENNADDDADIISEVEGQLLINDKGEVGYALDEVPEELLKDNPIYTDKTLAPKDLAAQQIEREIESAVDEALDDIVTEKK